MSALEFISALLGVAAALSVAMTCAWLIWRRTGNSGWVDTVWTFGIGATGFVGALMPIARSISLTPRQVLVALLIAAWSLRLGLHIARRTTGVEDDPRYAKLTRGWGHHAGREMFWLLQKQALVSIPLALAIVLAAWNSAPGLREQDWLAVLVLITAIVGETIADRQLRQFRAHAANHQRVCDVGLWNWSRHPNYFFQWLGWLAYPLLAIDFTGTYPWGWAALAAPLCMYWLLMHVSGIPPLEEHMVETRGDAFRAYQLRTNAFFPCPPRSI
jgi:steroid 5-alpha reductase family enzyme